MQGFDPKSCPWPNFLLSSCLIICFTYSGSEVHLAIKLVHRNSTFNNVKEAIEVNLTGYESQLAGCRPVGFVLAQTRNLVLSNEWIMVELQP